MGRWVSISTGLIYEEFKPISNDPQLACRIQLNCKDEDVIIYPVKMKTKEPFAKYNLRILNDTDNEVEIDGITFTPDTDDRRLLLSKTKGSVFNTNTFKFQTIEETAFPDLTKQEVAHKIMGCKDPTIIYYPKSTHVEVKLRASNLVTLKKGSSVITINKVNYKRIGNSDKFISKFGVIYNTTNLDFEYNNIIDSTDMQLLAHDVVGKEGEFYPKSTLKVNVIDCDNLKPIENDHICVNKIDMYRCKRHPNLFISCKLDVFDIKTFEFIMFDVKTEYSMQELAQIITNQNVTWFPTRSQRMYVLTPTNLVKLKPDMNSIKIDNILFYRHPRRDNVFISYKFETFNFDTFEIKQDKTLINDLTAQEFAQLIIGKNELVYPKITSLEYIFNPNNIDFVNPDSIIIDKVVFYMTNKQMFLKSLDNCVFNLETFKIVPNGEIEFNETVQDICHRITNDYTNLYYPLSMKIKNRVVPKNIAQVKDRIIIDQVPYTQHPYFKNIICSKKRFIDLNTFEFIERPTKEQLLPFILVEAIDIDDGLGEYVYNKNTNTINNQEIDWTDLHKATPISKLRYFHPENSEYYVNFYGELFKIEIDASIGKEIYKRVNMLNRKTLIIERAGKKIFVPIDEFIFECFNGRLVQDGCHVELINKYPLSNPYLHCKWHYKENNGKIDTEVYETIFKHPIHPMYGWDTETSSPYSFYTKMHLCIKSSFVTVERTSENNKIPKKRFRYECLNGIDIKDDFIIKGNKRVKFGTKEFVLNDEIFRITKNPYFYISNYNRIFYTRYERIVEVAGRYIILSRHKFENNIRLSDVIGVENIDNYEQSDV